MPPKGKVQEKILESENVRNVQPSTAGVRTDVHMEPKTREKPNKTSVNLQNSSLLRMINP